MLARDHSVSVTCEVLDCARSSFYHSGAEPVDELALRAAIKELAAEWPTYGYRRVTQQLRRQEWRVNHKRAQRLMQEMGLQAKITRRKQHSTNSEHEFPRYPNLVQDLVIVRPEQVIGRPTSRFSHSPKRSGGESPGSGCWAA